MKQNERPESLTPEPAIRVQNLTKSYRRVLAVNGLSFEVRSGEVFGFLGLNGAGKTTTIRILLDLLRPTAGEASIFGKNCQRDGLNARLEVGYLPAEMGLYSHLTGFEVLKLFAALGKRRVDPVYRDGIRSRLELEDSQLRRPLREFSTGMKRKLGLIQALQADPPLLILDEPTEGLDPLMQGAFYEILGELKSRGRTIFMSSHVLSEVERLCDRIALIRKGELVLQSTIDDIRGIAARRVRVSFLHEVHGDVRFPEPVHPIEIRPDNWELKVDGRMGELTRLLASFPVKDLQIDEPRLEDVILDYYREETK